MQLISRLTALAAVAAPFLAQAAPVPDSEYVPGKYIVRFRPDVDSATIAAHKLKVTEIHQRNILARRDLSKEEASGVEHEYGFGTFHGYSGGFDSATIEELKGLPEVLHVEQDSIMTTLDLQTQNDAPWGLGSISSKSGVASSYIYDSTAGANAYNYIIDTGVRITHQEFGGRAVWGYNAVNSDNNDNAGHGTHVAGIIGGSTYGVAKKVNIIAVKIFEGNSGTTATVLKGYDWAINDIVTNNRQNASVLNLSLGGPGSATWDAAITEGWNEGVLTVVAAGNDNQPAATRSPARSPETLCVGNLQADLSRFGGSSGSNYGSAVGIMAPGTNILSSYRTSDTATQRLTGTSMASPHVAGLVSYIRGLEGLSSAEKIKARVYELAVKGVMTDLQGSADRLAYNGNGR